MAVRWPAGFTSGAVASGIRKSGRLDLGALIAEGPVDWCGAFTRNAAAAPSVQWCRSRRGRRVRGVVVNSGNANACTGSAGSRAVEDVLGAAADTFGCSTSQLLAASTGPIGVPLPVARIVDALPALAGTLGPDTGLFAESILTTDTRIKRAATHVGDATLVGVAKGSAMLAPNMATMLAFVATDAVLPPDAQGALQHAVDATFNCISVDDCERTNDSVFLLASGIHRAGSEDFGVALLELCRDLAEQMARDAEGATRLVRIRVEGAGDKRQAISFGKAIAGSILWRAAVHGADANWGRILSALGSVDDDLDLSRLHLAIGREVLFSSGEPAGSPEAAAQEMAREEFTVSCRVGRGAGEAEVLSVDLSPEYVVMNAGGMS